MNCFLSAVDEFEKEALEQHNKYREVHNAPKMTLDREMCKKAEEYAQKLASNGVDGPLDHSIRSTRENEGESLFSGCYSDISAADIVRIW